MKAGGHVSPRIAKTRVGWLTARNFPEQLNVLQFKAPDGAINEFWKAKPEIFNVKPHHHNLGLNT
jgi:putative transposase